MPDGGRRADKGLTQDGGMNRTNLPSPRPSPIKLALASLPLECPHPQADADGRGDHVARSEVHSRVPSSMGRRSEGRFPCMIRTSRSSCKTLLGCVLRTISAAAPQACEDRAPADGRIARLGCRPSRRRAPPPRPPPPGRQAHPPHRPPQGVSPALPSRRTCWPQGPPRNRHRPAPPSSRRGALPPPRERTSWPRRNLPPWP